MTQSWNKDYARFELARLILLQVVDSIYALNNEVEFAVRVYGSEYPAQDKNCGDTRLAVPFNLQNVNQIKSSLQYINPIGSSPIAYSLSEAAFKEINNTNQYDYSIIFVTDGGETCNGDVCKTYLELLQKKVSVTPYIIGLDNNEILKTYYDCLGKYVEVTQLVDIEKAVKMIVDENRPILAKEKTLNLKTVYSNTSVIKDTPFVKTEVIVVKKDTPMDIKPEIVQVIPKVEEPAVVLQKAVRGYDVLPRIQLLTRKGMTKNNFQKPAVFTQTNTVGAIIKIDYEIEAKVVRTRDILPTIRLFQPRYRFTYAFQVPRFRDAVNTLTAVVAYDYTPIKRDTILTEIKPKVAVAKPKTNSNPTSDVGAEVSREIVPHPETMVQVFFINKFQKSKSYSGSTPTIIVEDNQTQKEVKRFIRKVRGREPELERIEPGTYNFTVVGQDYIRTKKVKIDANKINKIYIEVSDGMLQFAYKGNPKRPVEEFNAIVNLRFDEGETVLQKCVDKLPYTPGTYYIEVNTLPATKFITVDISFGSVKEIQIDEPGFLQITNSNKLGRVDLKLMVNDQYLTFHTMEIFGNFQDQKLMIQPGVYEASFLIDPAVPALGTKKVTFRIQSNKNTLLELK